MSIKTFILGSAVTLALSVPAFADVTIDNAYARSSGPAAKAGAAFFVINNTGDTPDRLISAATAAARVTQLHTHIALENGVVQMRHDEDGFAVPAGGNHALDRGGDHVMLMGLTGPLLQGENIELILTFEHAGEVTVTVPVDHERAPEGGAVDHSAMDHSHDAHDHNAKEKEAETDHSAHAH